MNANFDSSILEGYIKFREKKTWKRRFCVLRRLSPVANSLIVQLYKKSFNKAKGGAQMKASLNLEHLLGIESCFQLQKESQTLAVVCKTTTAVMAFESREMLLEWQAQIAEVLGHSDRYEVQLLNLPAKIEVTSNSAVLHIRDWQFCLLQSVPPKVIGFWNIADLRRFGAVDDRRFCFEGGSRCLARGIGGMFVIASSESHEIANKFDYAGRGRLCDSERRVHPPTSSSSGLLTPMTRHRLTATSRSQSMSKPSTPMLGNHRRVAEFCLSPPCARHARSNSRNSSISSGTRVGGSSMGLNQLHQSDPEILYDKPRSLNATTTQAIYETPGGPSEESRPCSTQPPYSHYDTPRRVLQRLDTENLNRSSQLQPPDKAVVYATVSKQPKRVVKPVEQEEEELNKPMEVQGYLVMQRTQGQWAEAQEYVRMQALPCSPATLLQRDAAAIAASGRSNAKPEELYQNSVWLQLQAESAFRCLHPKPVVHGTLPLLRNSPVSLRLRRSASMPAESSCRQGNRDSSDSTDSGVSVTACESSHQAAAVVPHKTAGCQRHVLLTRHWSSLPRPETPIYMNDPSTCWSGSYPRPIIKTEMEPSQSNNLYDILDVSVASIGYETCV